MVSRMRLLFFAAILLLPSSYARGEDTLEFERIVVTATRTGSSVQSAPASSDMVTADDINKKNAQTVDQALDDLSGVYDRRGKGIMDTQASVTLRGIPGQQRTLIMLDGVVLNRAYDGTVAFGGLPVNDVDRIEVVRGPFSSLYGGYAMGGVVNVLTKMPDKREAVLRAGYGADNSWKAYGSYGDKIKDKLRLFVSYGYTATDGYRTDNNVQTAKPTATLSGWTQTASNQGATRYLIGDKGNNGWFDDNLTMKVRYDLPCNAKITASFMRSLYGYNYSDPRTYLMDGKSNPVYQYGTVRQATFLAGSGGKIQNIYNVNFEKEFSAFKIKASVGLNDIEDSWYVTPGTTAATTSFGGRGTLSSTPSKGYNADLQFTMPLMKRHIVTFGGSFRYNWADTVEKGLTDWKDENSTFGLTYESKGKDRTFALFAQDEITIIKDLVLYLGLRQDWWGTFDGYANDVGKAGYPKNYGSSKYDFLSPKVAVVYKPLETTTIRASGGRAFRPPTLYELYRAWTSTTGTTYAGNPDLKPEKTLSWDFGIEQRFGRNISLRATYYEHYIEDMIYSRDITATYKDKVNVGKATVQGIELDASWRAASFLRFFANYTYNDAKVRENDVKPATEGKRLTMVPCEMFNAGFDIDKKPVSARVTGRYVGKRYSDDENRDKTNNVYLSYDPYFVVDAKIALAVTSFASMSLSVDNILDRDYFSSYKAPGRKWFLEMTLRY